MRKLLEVLGGLLLLTGGCGVVREFWPAFRIMGFSDRLIGRVGFLHGWELFAHIVLAVLGLVMVVVSGRTDRA
ncbi:hypothetical protein C6N75_14690 [Streptomyces solincola]|uniref:Uncharacterized protein n=1 Tax=Streptomyces solincola TaxID=2100817 RepID=A0A2S9PVM1_9ACTN|nr:MULTISPECIES: hypothetical protein [Streptomyces]PRH78476.1 hypothetical protein C6N75_14690 [Streptomyces solincola]